MNEANDIVNEEIHKLSHNADACFERVNARFQSVIDCVEQQRQEVLSEVRSKRDEKKKVLEDQLQIIQQEKSKVDSDVQVVNEFEIWMQMYSKFKYFWDQVHSFCFVLEICYFL